MPRKATEFSNNINIRITDEQKEKWNRYLANNPEFSSISHFIRFCVDEYIDGTHLKRRERNREKELKIKIKENEVRINEILNEQREILKMIAQKTEPSGNEKLKEYQRGVVLNLLRETTRDEVELSRLTDLPEIEILQFLNTLLEEKLITQEKNKYKVL